MTAIATKSRPREIRRMVRMLPAILSGRVRDSAGIGRAFHSRLAWTFLSLVRDDFNELGRGNAGADGRKWPVLSQSYLAYGRSTTGRGRPKAGGRWPGGKDGLMSKGQEEKWWLDYRRAMAWLLKRHDLKTAKGIAASIANKKYTDAGGQTKLNSPQFGKRKVGVDYQILVDRGILRNSLTPAELSDDYRPAKDQIFRSRAGEIVVGTNIPYAAHHHKGKRRLWPVTLPASWRRQIIRVARSGLFRLGELIAGGRF